VGTKQTPFKEGMILTCEPGLYIEEEGIGIRIETDIIVAEEPIDLMADYPVSVEEIELAMLG
jgi:Xaa-Pro aminopeptidase